VLAALPSPCPAPSVAQTLRWASQGDPQTMDPHSQNESMTNMMNGQVYERLIRRDQQPRTSCRGWPPSGRRRDRLTWRFKLRQGVKFHDGTPFRRPTTWCISINRGQEPTSQVNVYATAVGTPVKVDRVADGGVPARQR
jgi:peptide/nickel transport system substrate-binding protein